MRAQPAFGIRARLTSLVVVAVLPMLVMVALQYTEQRTRAIDSAEQRTAEVARLLADHGDEFARRVDVVLNAATLLVRISPSSLHYNDSVLTALDRGTLAPVGSLNVHDLNDNDIGSSVPNIPRPSAVRVGDRRFFRDALSTGEFSVGSPMRSRGDSTQWLVIFGLPVRVAAGPVRAVVYSTVQLDSLNSVLDAGSLPAGSVVTLVDRDGGIVYRSVETVKYRGQIADTMPTVREILRTPRGNGIQLSDFDHVERVVAWERLQHAPWTVVVGIPTAAILAADKGWAQRDLALVLLTVIGVLALAGYVAGRLSQPIETLKADAQALAGGDLTRRSGITTKSEVGTLATAFNQMAETIEWQTASLLQSELRYRMLFEGSPMPMWVWDATTLRFLAVNNACTARYGWTREQFLERTIRDVLAPSELPRFEALATIERSPVGRTSRWIHLTKRGEQFAVQTYWSSIDWADRPCNLTIIEDLSERHRAEADLAASQEQLRQMQKIEAVGNLAAGVAHDFNNLLTAILGSCDMAMLALAADDPAQVEMKYVRDAAIRATDLTKRLLIFSRQQAMEPQDVDVRGIVRGMQPLLTRTLGEQIVLDVRLSDTPCVVRIDPGQMEQIVLNLLLNSRDALARGGTVIVDVRRVVGESANDPVGPGDWVMFAVTDTGTGMDAATAARVFEPFFTTKERGRGTGIGLAVVFGIVQSAGGRIHLETAVGAGSSFRVYLPRRDVAPTGHSAPPTITATTAGGGTETILVVEDDESVRRVSVRILRGMGFHVLNAADPAAALELVREWTGPLDLLFTDVIMPGMNGRELAEEIHKIRPTLRVLYASGYTDDVELLRQLRENSVHFLQKPFTPTTLGAMIRAVLESPPEGV
jgi:hypothetical protein